MEWISRSNAVRLCIGENVSFSIITYYLLFSFSYNRLRLRAAFSIAFGGSFGAVTRDGVFSTNELAEYEALQHVCSFGLGMGYESFILLQTGITGGFAFMGYGLWHFILCYDFDWRHCLL